MNTHIQAHIKNTDALAVLLFYFYCPFQMHYQFYRDVIDNDLLYSAGSEVKVAQLCPTLCDPMDYTVHGVL